jgi:hypothetical protein
LQAQSHGWILLIESDRHLDIGVGEPVSYAVVTIYLIVKASSIAAPMAAADSPAVTMTEAVLLVHTVRNYIFSPRGPRKPGSSKVMLFGAC